MGLVLSGKDSIEVEILTENPSVTTTIVSRAPQVEVDMDMPLVAVPTIEKTTEILKGDNNGNAVAATPNEDYQTPLTAGTDYQTPLPPQSGNDGKFLKTNGSTMSWGAAYVKPANGIPSSDLDSDVQASLGKADTALQSAPVTSVNTQTGDVVITAAGLGAYEKPSGGIPASDLDSSVQTSLGKADTALQSAPVTSVNNATGDVVITAAGLGAYEKPSGGIPATDLADTYAASHTANGAAELTVAIPYGEVDSTSVKTAFTATVAGIYELKKGVVCYIRNDVVTGTTNCTLNINGLGAKPIYASNADTTRMTSAFSAASTWLLVYNETRVTGGCWDAYYGSVNSNSIGYQVRTNSSRLPVKTYCGRYRLLFTAPDGMNYVPANADTQTSAAKTHTVTTEPIDPFGTIRYYGSTTILQADALPAATALWQQYVVTLGYSFNNANAALALTVNTPVYIKCRPNADGSANIDTTTPYVQALPTTEDGYIYIFLGICDAATTVEVQVTHPIYQYKSGKICLYTGA